MSGYHQSIRRYSHVYCPCNGLRYIIICWSCILCNNVTWHNYYKRMAASVLIETIDRSVVDSIIRTSETLGKQSPEYKVIGKVGKLGG